MTLTQVWLGIGAIVVLLGPRMAAAQEPGGHAAPRANKAVYGELFGNGFIYSANYERRLGDSPVWGRVGFETCAPSHPALVIPLLVEAVLGPAPHHLEIGAGFLTVPPIERGRRGGVMPTAVIGYRYQRDEGGLTLRAGFTPFLIPDADDFPPYWFGVSVGRSF